MSRTFRCLHAITTRSSRWMARGIWSPAAVSGLAVTMAVAYGMRPFVVHAMGGVPQEAGESGMLVWAAAGFIVERLFAAGVLLTLMVVACGNADARGSWAISCHLGLIGAFAGVATLSVLQIRGLGADSTLQVPLGLNALWPAGTPAANALLGSLGPFDLAGVWLIHSAVRLRTQSSKARAAVVAVGYWGLTVGIRASLGLLGSALGMTPTV